MLWQTFSGGLFPVTHDLEKKKFARRGGAKKA
jgi:hypothetical protein